MQQKNINMGTLVILLCLGLIAGMLSGLVGIGGGIVIVPALIYFMGYSQHQAQGTVLFMFLLPIGILGVFNYYQAGYIEWKTALVMGSTFIIGSYFGSKLSISIDQVMLRKVFGVIIFLLSLKMIFGK